MPGLAAEVWSFVSAGSWGWRPVVTFVGSPAHREPSSADWLQLVHWKGAIQKQLGLLVGISDSHLVSAGP